MVAFMFENGCKETEALITALSYDESNKKYHLTVLGVEPGGHNYTVPGKAWFSKNDFKELLNSKSLESEYQVIGMKIKFEGDGVDKEKDKIEKNQYLEKLFAEAEGEEVCIE